MTSLRTPRRAVDPVYSAPLDSNKYFIDRKTLTWEYAVNFTDAATQTDSATPAPVASSTKKQNVNSWMYENANDRAVALRLVPSDIPKNGSAKNISLDDGFVEYCSYSFKTAENTTIYVPGSPAEYVEGLKYPLQLKPEEGFYYRDRHIEKVSSSHFEPAAQTTAFANPKATFDEVDVMANRSTLHYLLQFANNKTSQEVRLGLAMVNNTLIISRIWPSAKTGVGLNTYGHSFEDATTLEDQELEGVEGYYKFIGYSFTSLYYQRRRSNV
jgi:hypothetical protein